MKKTIFLVVVLPMIFVLAGCNQKTTDKKNDSGVAVNQSTQNKSEEPIRSITYRDEILGFEFQYPNDWILDDKGLMITPKNQKKCDKNITGQSDLPTCLDFISFGEVENVNKLSLENLFKEEYGWKDGENYKNLQEHKIGTTTAYRVTTISAYDGTENNTFWLPLSDGDLFTISESYLDTEEKTVFENIITSFKLIN